MPTLTTDLKNEDNFNKITHLKKVKLYQTKTINYDFAMLNNRQLLSEPASLPLKK